MKKVILVVLFAIIIVIFVIYLVIQAEQQERLKLVLDKCVDGDTAWFYQGEERIKVRILGIDAPESTNYVEEYGKEASDYTCNLLSNSNNIYIEYDINSDKYDKYNRVLGWVFVDNNNLSELLLSKGYAEVKYIYGDYKYIDDLCIAQKVAYDDKLGIWSISDYNYEDNYCDS